MHKIVLASCLLVLTLDMPVHACIVVSLTPPAGQVNIGQAVGVSIDISGLDSSVALSSYDLNLGFDPGLLHFDSAIFGDSALGDQLDLAGLGINFPSATAGTGLVNLVEFSLDTSVDLLNLQADRFTLATLYFTSLASGNSPLHLTLNSLADSEANDLSATTLNSSVTVSAVPVPAAFWLFGSGLALLRVKRKLTI